MNYEVSTDSSRVQFDVVHAWLASSYWATNIRPDVLRTAIERSLVASAFDADDGVQVGFARVVTDGATFAWLCDVYVGELHRGRGLARRLVGALIELPALATVRRWCLATRDAHAVYTPLGFAPVKPGRWLERVSDARVWQTAS